MGPWTEYSGLRFAFFMLAEYAGIVVMSVLFAVLYLGGWRGVGVDAVPALGVLWVLAKAGGVAFVLIWVRVSWPRLREDQLQHLAWARLVPLALLQARRHGRRGGGHRMNPKGTAAWCPASSPAW